VEFEYDLKSNIPKIKQQFFFSRRPEGVTVVLGSRLMLAARITLPYFSVSSAMGLPGYHGFGHRHGSRRAEITEATSVWSVILGSP
jgi:hypothetical protein